MVNDDIVDDDMVDDDMVNDDMVDDDMVNVQTDEKILLFICQVIRCQSEEYCRTTKWCLVRSQYYTE